MKGEIVTTFKLSEGTLRTLPTHIGNLKKLRKFDVCIILRPSLHPSFILHSSSSYFFILPFPHLSSSFILHPSPFFLIFLHPSSSFVLRPSSFVLLPHLLSSTLHPSSFIFHLHFYRSFSLFPSIPFILHISPFIPFTLHPSPFIITFHLLTFIFLTKSFLV